MNPKIFNIPSTTLVSECETIFEIASKLPNNSVVVEIGTGAGRVTAVIAEAIAGKGSVLYTIDNYSQTEKYGGYGAWDHNNAARNISELQLDGHVVFIAGDSVEFGNMPDKLRNIPPIDMIYLDGSHNYADVCAELDAWLPHVKPGGIVAGHDFDINCSDGRHVIKAICDKLLINPDRHMQAIGRVWWGEV